MFKVKDHDPVLVAAYDPVVKARRKMGIENTDAHHVPQKALLASDNITAQDGIVVNINRQKHHSTSTFGKRPAEGVTGLETLKGDLEEIKDILQESYGFSERQAQSVCRVVTILNKKIRGL